MSKYRAIYAAVQDRDKDALKQAFIDLQNTGYKPIDIRKQIAIRYRPYYAGSLEPRPVLHENPKLERQFVASLTAPQRKLYESARKQRQSDWAWVPELYKP